MKFIPQPIAFRIGSWPIYWYGILLATAISLGTYLVLKEAKKKGLDPDQILNIILMVLPAAFWCTFILCNF